MVLQRPTINPYRYAGQLILNRLRWDLSIQSFRSRRLLCQWRNRYIGHKAVIVCNGPSLLRSNLSLLDGCFSFGLNKINMLFPSSDFRPSCIVSVNSLVLEQNASYFNETPLPLFLDSSARCTIPQRPNIVFLHSSFQEKLAKDCSISVNQGHTVTVVALQLAFHMGFHDVALIGCDHNFATKGPADLAVTSGKVDASHFDPKYFSNGQKWQLPDLPGSEYYYALARDLFAAHNRRIVNCTEGGLLEIFPRMTLKEWRVQAHGI